MATAKRVHPQQPHRRYNPLSGSWVLCSPQRALRPWAGANESNHTISRPFYDADCYLCPGNKRASHHRNPNYRTAFTFENDFQALLQHEESTRVDKVDNSENPTERKHSRIIQCSPAFGICHVHFPTPDHGKRLCDLRKQAVIDFLVSLQQFQHNLISTNRNIQSILLFENRGSISGQSSPHPHWQSWATHHIPEALQTEANQFHSYSTTHPNRCMLCEYIQEELKNPEQRVIWTNDEFVLVVPYWAFWPFETLILPRKHACSPFLNNANHSLEKLAEILQYVVGMYDEVFDCEFSYTMGCHQLLLSPNQHDVSAFHWHIHYQPMLQRGPNVRKHAVGYDVFGEPQRDIPPEQAAKRLRTCFETYLS